MSIQKKNFSDIVTFTRASGGTSFRPVGRGTLVNQLLYSQWGGGGTGPTGPTGWNVWAGGGTEGALLPSGLRQRVFTPTASQPFIHQTVTLAANTTYTFAVYVHESTGGITQNNILFWGGSMIPGATFSVSTAVAPSEAFVIATITTAATAGTLILRVGGGAQSPTTGAVTLSAPALFVGTVTAQQILDNGGIPLTYDTASNLLRLDRPGDPIQLFTAPANVPRFDYDPVSRQCKGLLVEEQRTNLITYSSDFENAAWFKTAATVTGSTEIAPDGTLTADKIVATSANTQHYTHFATASVAANTAGTFSVYAKAAGQNSVSISASGSGAFVAIFDLVAGTVSYQLGGTGAIASVGNGWYRCSFTCTTTAFAFVPYVFPGTFASYAGDGVSGVHMWGGQHEAGAFPTSYIPTSGAVATRALEQPVVNTLSPWYNASEGTLFMDVGSSRGTSTQYATAASLVGSAIGVNYVAACFNAYNTSTLITGGSTMVQPAVVSGPAAKLAIGMSPTSQSMVVNGGAVVTRAASAPLDQMTALRLGYWEGNPGQLNGHITRIRYIPKRLSGAKLQALTTLTYGAPYGPERVTNGDLSNGSTSWTLDSGISVGAGKLNFNTVDATPFALNIGTVEAGKVYEAVFYTTGFASGGVSLANNGTSFGAVFSANGECRQTVAATQTGQLAILARLGPTVVSVDNISIREASIIL